MLRFGDKAGFSPYAAYSHGRVKLDGYAETSGAFPVVLSDTKMGFDELRLGGQTHVALGDASKLQFSGEWVHRFDNGIVQMSGNIVGVGAFAVAAPSPRDDWGRAGMDLDLGLSRSTLLSFSGHAVLGRGEDASLAGSASLRFAF